jgi:VIT1/CCC1 family predicted Fe2+/Mn2+ transporter
MPDYDLIKACCTHFAKYMDDVPSEAKNRDYESRPKFPILSSTWDDIGLGLHGRGEQLKRREWQLFMERVVMAFTGGAFLVGPMLIMVLVNSLVASLVVTSVAVLLFGLVMCFMVDKKFDVMSGTAAFAAVLVVFVGTSMESS